MSAEPKIILVGAGPGDPELITLKGLKAIQQADAILYDALVAEELLAHAKPGCVKTYVGKRYNQPSTPQEEINKLLVSYALHYGTVVRLKGGDPFVFGRATEEIDYATEQGIAIEVIPGLSSVTAVPAAAKVPLTLRNVSRGFRVLTATTSEDELSQNIQDAANGSDTVVVLMGVNKLPEICEAFILAGKTEIPVAIIQNGTTPQQKVVTGYIHNITEKAKKEGVESPAVIVIGEAVKWGRGELEGIANNLTGQHHG